MAHTREQWKRRKDGTTKGSEESRRAPSAGVTQLDDLSSFGLEQCIIEVRYPDALVMWDKAGILWRSVQDRWPEIKLTTADPVKQVFQNGKTGFVAEIRSARITSVDSHKSLDELSQIAREFFKLTAKHLQIPLFTRLGLRLIYFKEFENRKAAGLAFHSLGLVRVPEGKKFEIDEDPVNQQYSLRWESAKKGTYISCKADTRKVDYEPPMESVRVFDPIHREQNGIVLDVDYYTVAPVDTGQVDMGEWMNHGVKIVARDTRYLFEG